MSGQLRLRVPLPSVMVATGLTPIQVESVQAALRGARPVHVASRFRECREFVEHAAGVVIVCTVPTGAEAARGQQLLEFRARFPHVTLVALFVEGESDSRWALELGRVGVTELVACRQRVPADALIAALARSESDGVAARIWKVARLQVSDALTTVLKAAVRCAHSPISMERFAAAAQMHERTLRKYCVAHGLASPQWIIGWARLLVAAYYLEEPGRTVQSVAELLQFPSAASLANHVRRYAHRTPSELRANRAILTVARLLEQRLASRDAADVAVPDPTPVHRTGNGVNSSEVEAPTRAPLQLL